MKTAEELSKIVSGFRSDMKFVDQLKEVQLDAFKAGMTAAAEIAERYLPAKNTPDSSPVPDIIRDFRDNKTSL